jgi:hypothetical protein
VILANGMVRKGRQAAVMVFAAVFLSWPALFNGAAFFFPDTHTYLRNAGAVVYALTGLKTDWADRYRLYVPAPETDAAPQDKATPPAQNVSPELGHALHPVLIGRSIYYGLLLLPFVTLFGSLGGVFIQASLAVAAVWITLRAFNVDRSRLPAVLGITVGFLGVFTSLPFFVSLLMPDVFTGFAVAMALSALFGWHRLCLSEKVTLVAIACLATMSHGSNVLILLAIFAVGAVARLRFRAICAVGLGVLLVAVLAGLAGERLFVAGVSSKLGEPPIRPPFLTARLIDEGPALRLLRERCPQIELEACHYLDRMPHDSDTFLWSRKPDEGVFSAVPHAVQRRLAKQDMHLALETLRAYPVEVIRDSILAGGRQLLLLKVDIINLPSADGYARELPPRYAREVLKSRAATADVSMRFFNLSICLTTLAAAVFLMAVVARFTRKEFQAAALLVLAAIFANALITGALSKPHNRYNARLIWVLPLVAGAILISSKSNARENRDEEPEAADRGSLTVRS